ncbi:MAG: glycosyltransferase family 4 protein [Burkholderiales bacterium]
MVGTDPQGRGGIASVVQAYREAGLFERCALHYVSTHAEGGRLHKLGMALRGAWAAWRALASGEVAVVHAHVASGASFVRKSVLLALARRSGAGTVFHLHGGGFQIFHRRGGPLMRWWIRHTLERSSVVLCLSESWRRVLLEIAPQARVQVLRNAVRVPAQAESAGDPRRLLYLGLISRQKGLLVLAEALSLLRSRGLVLTLAVGGTGDSQELLERAAALGVAGQVQLLGWIGPQRRDEELRRAAIFVLPSFDEGLPMALLEAMAAAKAVVTTPVGGIPELVSHGCDGLLVPAGDAPALADALGRLAADPALCGRLGQAARHKVLQHYAVNVAVDRLVACYAMLGIAERAVPR